MKLSKTLNIIFLLMFSGVAIGQSVVNNDLLSDEADGTNWASYGRTFSEHHFSPLTEINNDTIDDLGLAWYYDLPPMASVMTAPLAIDGILYFAVGYSVVHAMDARTGELLWRYDPDVPSVAGKRMRGGWGIRGIAFWEGKVFTGTHDGRLIALDAENGEPLWSVQTLEDDAAYITGPPWVFNGKVAIGFGGADFGPTRGYVTAYDAETGEKSWRFYLVPGNPADGFENEAMEMAAATWTGEWWKFGGGGTAWHAMAYDPKFNHFYIGVGNGMPVNHKIRSPDGGDNLFLASIVAIDADSGEYVWHYQANPGETWDYTNNMDIQLADLVIDGKERSVILHAPKNGFFYVIDRADGKLISAEKFASANWAERIDLETGRPVENPEARFPEGSSAMVIPGSIGAHSVMPMSFSPLTGLVYIPKIELGRTYGNPQGNLREWEPLPGLGVNQAVTAPPPAEPLAEPWSALQAWDPVKQEEVWSVPMDAGVFNGGTAATSGNLVLQGQVTGEFAAYAADTGKKLWSFDTQAGVQAQPITYLADGRQYITLITGFRGMGRPSGAEPGWDYRKQQRRVLTFVLGGETKLPAPVSQVTPFVDDPDFVVDAEKAAIGSRIVNAELRCGLCHGVTLLSGGGAPDLRKSSIPLSFDALSAVIRDGALLSKGMPVYAEFSDEEIEGIQHYVRQEARLAISKAESK